MKKKYYILLILFLNPFLEIKAQLSDSTAILLDSVDIYFEPDMPIMGIENNYNLGIFATPNYTGWFIGIDWSTGIITENCDGLNPSFTSDVGGAFKSGYPLKKDSDLKMKDKWSKDDDTRSYPGSTISTISLSTAYHNRSLPLTLQLNIGYSWVNSVLYYYNQNLHYYSKDGTIEKLKELNVLYLDQGMIAINPELKLDVWGAFKSRDLNTYGSSYYISLGYKYSYSFFNEMTQYKQIIDPKDKIRYVNGLDTICYFYEKSFKEIRRKNESVEIGFGVNIANSSVIRFDFGISYSIPLDNVLNEGYWRNNAFTLRLGLALNTIIFGI